mgnify:CR=1 FL=1
MVESHEMMEETLFLSLDYTLVQDVNEYRPDATAGYCVYRNVGGLQREILTSMDIDFVVIEEAVATSDLIYDFREAWIPVFVWTVKDAESMQRYLEMGAVGLVTDYPETGREMIVLYLAFSNTKYLSAEEWK